MLRACGFIKHKQLTANFTRKNRRQGLQKHGSAKRSVESNKGVQNTPEDCQQEKEGGLDGRNTKIESWLEGKETRRALTKGIDPDRARLYAKRGTKTPTYPARKNAEYP